MSLNELPELIKSNSDFLIIAALLIILQKEKADQSLLFALLFIAA